MDMKKVLAGVVIAGAAAGAVAAETQAPDMMTKLTVAMNQLSTTRQVIADERIPMGEELSAKEKRLAAVHKEYEELKRKLDTRTLDLSNLRSEIKSRTNEKNYISGLLDEYVRNFETRLHIAELQVYGGVAEEARLAAENSNLVPAEVYKAQSALVMASMDRILKMNGGMRFEGTAAGDDGLVKKGEYALVGPVALFAAFDDSATGVAEQRLGSLEPTVIAVEDVALNDSIKTVARTGAGTMPFDATLGNAHKIEETKTTIMDEIRKGGIMMYPILAMFVAAIVISLVKWIQLAAVPMPKDSAVFPVLRSLAKGNVAEVKGAVAQLKGPAAEMLQAGADHIGEPKELIEELMFEKMLEARVKLQRALPFVAVAAACGPLMGLLGTVTGIINTFKLITVFGSGDVKMLSGGISEALITTKYGLIIAIPSLVLHAFLSRKAKGLIDRMEKIAISFMNQLGKKTDKVEVEG